MKKNYLKPLFLFLLLPVINYAQVGIGIANPKAHLDIEASSRTTPKNTDGILIPRIDVFPTTNPTADQKGMLVYLTTTVGTNAPGFYYWDSAWNQVSGSTGWSILGNTGTTSGTNFLGTTDPQALDFRTDNVIRARITTKGQIEVFNTGRSVFIGAGAGANDDLTDNDNVFVGNNAGTANTTGVVNVAIGPNALSSNTVGAASIAIGNSTLAGTTVQTNNVAIGNSAMAFGSTPSFSVAIGSSALLNANGFNNVGIGIQTLANATTGNNNTAIGALSGSNIKGNDNVSIGYRSDQFNHNGGQNVVIGTEAGITSGSGNDNDGNVLIGYNAAKDLSTDNSLYIENSSSVTPLIYGEFDNDVVRIGGQLQIGSKDDTTAGAIYSFPLTDGTVGQALTTNGAGVVSWNTVSGGGADTQDLSIDNSLAEISLVDGGKVKVSTIADADSNTKIQVDKAAANDDVIRFDIAGNEHFRMDKSGHIEVLNNGSSVFIGEGAGEFDNLVDNRNVYIGKNVGRGSTKTRGRFNVGLGYEAAKSISGSYNSIMGFWSGRSITGTQNLIMGSQAGNFKYGSSNIGLGAASLGGYNGSVIPEGSVSVDKNTAIGKSTLGRLLDGGNNVAIGYDALSGMDAGDFNIGIGVEAGEKALSGSQGNIFIGKDSGGATLFTNSILIGEQAGAFEGATASDRLVIETSSGSTPLIGGDFNTNKVGINVDLSVAGSLSHTLTVGGAVYATNYIATAATSKYADYVFEDYFGKNATINEVYKFTPLKEAVKFVEENGHLPNVKSYKEIKENNFEISLSDTSLKNLEKIEENFLYIKELNEQKEALEKKNKELEKRVEKLEKMFLELKKSN